VNAGLFIRLGEGHRTEDTEDTEGTESGNGGFVVTSFPNRRRRRRRRARYRSVNADLFIRLGERHRREDTEDTEGTESGNGGFVVTSFPNRPRRRRRARYRFVNAGLFIKFGERHPPEDTEETRARQGVGWFGVSLVPATELVLVHSFFVPAPLDEPCK
jgi:hypothetical protein